MSYDLEIEIRSPQPSDRQYLFNSWLTSLRFNKPFNSLEKYWYFAAGTALLSRILFDSQMLVGSNPSNSDQIFGYVVFNRDNRALHFIYVKKNFRRAKIATRLMEAAFENFDEPILYTTKTTAIVHYEKRWNLEYGPHLLGEMTKEQEH